MAAQKAAGLMSAGGGNGSNQYQRATGSKMDPRSNDDTKPITLAEAGIDKHLADRARKAAATPRS
jgi:hypothetical protein